MRSSFEELKALKELNELKIGKYHFFVILLPY